MVVVAVGDAVRSREHEVGRDEARAALEGVALLAAGRVVEERAHVRVRPGRGLAADDRARRGGQREGERGKRRGEGEKPHIQCNARDRRIWRRRQAQKTARAISTTITIVPKIAMTQSRKRNASRSERSGLITGCRPSCTRRST